VSAAPDRWLDLLLASSRLKTTPRVGWHLRGVPAPESVADHTWGTALIALVLCALAPEAGDGEPDRGRALAMALLHDLPECVVGDLPRSATRLLPEGAKEQAETAALAELLSGVPAPAAEDWQALDREYRAATSLEARLVRDADRLDLLLQATVYAETTGNRRLDEFWAERSREDFATAAGGALFAALGARRRS